MIDVHLFYAASSGPDPFTINLNAFADLCADAGISNTFGVSEETLDEIYDLLMTLEERRRESEGRGKAQYGPDAVDAGLSRPLFIEALLLISGAAREDGKDAAST